MRRTFAATVLAAVAVAAIARLAYGPAALGYDALWALRWGDELLDLGAPSFDAPFAPTPHPLANAVSALAMLAGADAATTVVSALSWLSLGFAAVFAARLGAALFGWPAGLLAGAALATRAVLALETAQAYVDVAFLALVLAAADREVRRPGRGHAPAVLLALAGLLRPEAWALGAAYLAYRHRDALRLAPILAAAPLLWALMDLWATGDPLHSLHGTQELAGVLDRPRGADSVFSSASIALREIVQEPLLWVALAGGAAGLTLRARDSALPAALLGLGLAGFLVLGVAGLPLLGRYLLVPACMLLLFAGLAVFGWVQATGDRRLWQAGGALAAAVTLAAIPGDVEDLEEVRDYMRPRVAIQQDLRAAVRATEHLACAEVAAPDRRTLAVIAAQRDAAAGDRGRLVFTYATPEVASIFALGPTGVREPPAAERVRESRYWRVAAAGC